MRHYRSSSLSAAAALLLGGCVGMSEEACLVSDWRTIGFEDGALGRPVATIGSYRQACGKHGIAPDLELYRAGHDEGVVSYCRPAGGFDTGRRGAAYHGVCPADLEPDFLAGYYSGRRLHELESALREADERIASNVRSQEQIKRELAEIAAETAGSETTSEERVRLITRAAELGRRHGELSAQSDALRQQRAVQQVELEEYRQTLAYGF